MVTQGGVKPDPEKVKCLEEFVQPTNITSLRAILGLAIQLGAFVSDLSQSLVKMPLLLPFGHPRLIKNWYVQKAF